MYLNEEKQESLEGSSSTQVNHEVSPPCVKIQFIQELKFSHKGESLAHLRLLNFCVDCHKVSKARELLPVPF